MTDYCTACGQRLPRTWPEEEDRLRALLRGGHPHREVYRAGDGSGRWFVTYGGGEFSEQSVRALVKKGVIQSVYSNCPNDCFHVGRTLDIDRTLAERKKHRRGKDAPKIYVDDPVAEGAS